MKRRYLSMLLALTVGVGALVGCESNEKVEDNKNVAIEQDVNTNKSNKARTVITTDGEVDDMNSVIRFMLYANEVDLEGIVLTSSVYHYAGDEEKGIEPFRWTGTEWLDEFIDAYGEVYPNLSVHAEGYPEPEYLKSISKIGNISNVGEMEEVTEGSEFLKELFLQDSDSPLYVQTWGGTNTTARALKSIEEEYKDTDQWEEIKQKVYDNVVIYIILDQDDSYSEYIAKNWPNIRIINDSSNFWRFAYAWQFNPKEVNNLLQGEWQYENIKSGHGALLERYALMGDGNYIEGELEEEQRGIDAYLENNKEYNRYDFISEGDSPSFLYLIDNGLRSLEDPTYGGWGGRFGVVSDTLWKNTVLDFDPYTGRYEAEYSLMRWFDDIQNDFAARADWCIASKYEDANHAPKVSVKEGIDLTAKAGETIVLNATAEDPDNDEVSFKWWHYAEADTYEESKVEKNDVVEEMNMGLLFSINRELADGEVVDNIELKGAETSTVEFKVPEDAKSGDTIHIIVEAIDNGKFNLKHYQRVIITVE